MLRMLMMLLKITDVNLLKPFVINDWNVNVKKVSGTWSCTKYYMRSPISFWCRPTNNPRVKAKVFGIWRNCKRPNFIQSCNSNIALNNHAIVPFVRPPNTKSCQCTYQGKPPRCTTRRRFDVACMSVCLTAVCRMLLRRSIVCFQPLGLSRSSVARARRQVFNFKLRTRLASKLARRLRVFLARLLHLHSLSLSLDAVPTSNWRSLQDVTFCRRRYSCRPSGTFPTPVSEIYLTVTETDLNCSRGDIQTWRDSMAWIQSQISPWPQNTICICSRQRHSHRW